MPTSGLDLFIRDLELLPEQIKRAGFRAINETVRAERLQINKKIRQDTNLKSRLIRDRLKITNATKDRLAGIITPDDRRISLFEFRARRTKKGIAYTISKSSGKKVIAGGFIGKDPRGKTHVWRRLGDKRLPIDPKFGPSISVLMGNFLEEVREESFEKLAINFERRLNFERRS